MRQLKQKEPRLSRLDFDRRAAAFLEAIQEQLMPEHAKEFVAINMVTGEYVLGPTPHEVFAAYRVRWPDVLMYRCRVDGGPATKFHGR